MGEGHRFAAIVAGLAIAGCNSASPPPATMHLVDAAYRRGATVEPATLIAGLGDGAHLGDTAGLPFETIQHDTRYVLASHEDLLVSRPFAHEPGAGGRRPVSIEFGDTLAGATHVLLEGPIRIGKRDVATPPLLIPVDERAGARVVRPARVDHLLGLFAPGNALIRVHRPSPKRTRYRTPPLRIPHRGVLEFAVGIVDAAAAFGPVRASIEACQDARCRTLFDHQIAPERTWQDHRVDLSELGGDDWSFVFATDPIAPSSDTFSLPVWGDPTIRTVDAPPPPGPNVIMISIDTLRRDHLSLYGYTRDTSPFMANELAPRAAVFESAIAEAATTGPSHMTMFTSLPALVHGVTGGFDALAVPATTLAETARAHGYHTAAFTEGGPMTYHAGFNQGFAAYTENTARPGGSPGDVRGTFTLARAWLDGHRDRPFFLFVHTFQVHSPYRPPAAYDTTFALDDGSGPPPTAPDDGRKKALAYDREIRFVDDELRALVAWLDEQRLLEHAILMVTADHGEEFYEHGQLGHGTLPYEQVMRVPLLFAGAGVAPGRRIATAVHHVDYLATVLDLMRLPAAAPNGRSFAPLVRGEPFPAGDAPRPLVSATWTVPQGIAWPAFTVRDGMRKLIQYQSSDGAAHTLLYDLATDPAENSPLTEDTAPLETVLATYRAHAKQLTPKSQRIPNTTTPSGAPPRMEDQLRALGYIE